MDQHDLNALKRCIDIKTKWDDEWMTRKLKNDPWIDVAQSAAYSVQIKALGLKPWQSPPCVCSPDDPNAREKDGQKLLVRMLDAGLSRWEPDPMAALAKAERRRPKIKICR